QCRRWQVVPDHGGDHCPLHPLGQRVHGVATILAAKNANKYFFYNLSVFQKKPITFAPQWFPKHT
ncbi:MAG: hypothetical protein RSC11_08245, partial [Mucinivorans sp.]